MLKPWNDVYTGAQITVEKRDFATHRNLAHAVPRPCLAVLCCLPLAVHAQPPDAWSALYERVNAAIVGTGRLEVSSQPGGAKVLINGEWRGNTPTEPGTPLVLMLPQGPYRIEAVIESSGLRASEDVYLAKDAIQPVRLLFSGPESIPETIRVHPGSFDMGSPHDEPGRDDERPQRPWSRFRPRDIVGWTSAAQSTSIGAGFGGLR